MSEESNSPLTSPPILDLPSTKQPPEALEDHGAEQGVVNVLILVDENRQDPFLGKSEDEDRRNNQVSAIFSDPYFRTQRYITPCENEEDCEQTRILSALKFAKNHWPNGPIIIVKDTTISNVPSAHIASRVRSLLKSGIDFDIFYLCKWLDQCQKYQEVKLSEENVPSHVYWSHSPWGTQALLFTPGGRDILLGTKSTRKGTIFNGKNLSIALNNSILNGGIKAIVSFPNLVHYDVRFASTNKDYFKMNECQGVSPNKSLDGGTTVSSPIVTPTANLTSYIWFAIIVIVILIVAWAVIQIGPR